MDPSSNDVRKFIPALREKVVNMKEHANPLVRNIGHILGEMDMDFYFNEDRCFFRIGCTHVGDFDAIDVFIEVHDDFYLLRAELPMHIKGYDAENCNRDMIQRMTEFVCRINSRIRYGNFVFFCDNGRLFYQFSARSGNPATLASLVPENIYLALSIIEVFNDGFMRIYYSNVRPKVAAEDCSCKLHPDLIAEPGEDIPEPVIDEILPDPIDPDV